MIQRLILALLFTISIPAVGYGIAYWRIDEIDRYVFDPYSAERICHIGELVAAKDWRWVCSEAADFILLKQVSLWAGVAALALMVLFALLALTAGRDRWLNAAIFPTLIPIASLAVAVLVLAQAAILVYGAWMIEQYMLREEVWLVIGVVAIGALAGLVQVVRALFGMRGALRHGAFAKQLDQASAPRLWAFVGEICDRLKAARPDNIVAGLEPTFYATAAKTHLINDDKTLAGETLYLSLPLMRLFNEDELKAVVGHEMGHFCGQDTQYSLKFAPVYAGLGNSIETLSGGGFGINSLLKLPAVSMLSLMLHMFARNERRISRAREFEADRAGAEVSSPRALATSLGKAAIYSHLWGKIRADNVERLNAAKITANLSAVYEDSAKYDISHRAMDEIIAEILETRIAHPTDSHPSVSERYRNIEFAEQDLTAADLIEVGSAASRLLEGLETVEEELTLVEHRLMVAVGAVRPPPEESSEPDHNAHFLNAIYSLAAAMVGADGRIEQSEIQLAEQIGANMFKDFDAIDFRAFCNALDEIPKFKDVVELLESGLTDKGKVAIYEYLREIAFADEDLAEEEKALLIFVRQAWGLEI